MCSYNNQVHALSIVLRNVLEQQARLTEALEKQAEMMKQMTEDAQKAQTENRKVAAQLQTDLLRKAEVSESEMRARIQQENLARELEEELGLPVGTRIDVLSAPPHAKAQPGGGGAAKLDGKEPPITQASKPVFLDGLFDGLDSALGDFTSVPRPPSTGRVVPPKLSVLPQSQPSMLQNPTRATETEMKLDGDGLGELPSRGMVQGHSPSRALMGKSLSSNSQLVFPDGSSRTLVSAMQEAINDASVDGLERSLGGGGRSSLQTESQLVYADGTSIRGVHNQAAFSKEQSSMQ